MDNLENIQEQMKKTYKKYKCTGSYDFEVDERIFNDDIQELLSEENE